MGLYLQISIVFLLCLTLVSILYLIIKSNIKEIMHDKIVQFIEKKRFIVISKGISKVKVGRKKQKTRPIQFITISAFVIIVLISNILTINKSKILNMYNKLENICVIGEIVNLEKQNDYYMIYKVSVKNINESNIRKKSYVLVKIKKNNKNNFKLGDIIKVNGKIENPDEQKNYRGFNYKRYLQGKNIATVVVGDTAYKLNKTNKKNIYYIKNKIIENVEKILAENNKERINNKNNIEIRINFKKISNKMQLEVIDNGIGIPSEEINNVMKRFYKVDKSRKHNSSFGIGLSIASRIVKNYNGEVFISSELDKYTKVTVVFKQ